MEDITLLNLWKAQEKKLDRTMRINLFLLESMQKQKAQSKLKGLARLKTGTVILGIAYILLLGLLIYGNQFKNIYFSISLVAILLFNVLAVGIYIQHISLIRHIDYSQSITNAQEKLSRLQASTFNTRFLFLQTPFYATWFWSTPMIEGSLIKFWLISAPIALFFTLLAIWLYRNLKPENMHKKWVRTFIQSNPEHKSVMEAQKFLNEIEVFKTQVSDN
jgi:hypothetical protein